MTTEQYRIADLFLKIIANNSGQVNTDQYAPNFSEDGAIDKDFLFVRQQLIDLKIIQFVPNSQQYRIMFSLNGLKAQKVGLKMFIEADIVISQYLDKKKSAIAWTQVCLDLNISEDSKDFVLQKIVDSGKFILKTISRDRIVIQNNKNIILSKTDTVKDKIETKTVEKKNKLKQFFYDQYIVTILGGLGLSILTLILNTKSCNIFSENTFYKPIIDIKPYKIPIENTTYPIIDTLEMKIKYQGSKVILNPELISFNYLFTNESYFYKDPQFISTPSLEILESNFDNLILDSLNNASIFKIQIRRKMIFNGIDVAYFNIEDKTIIGNLKIALSYKYLNENILDTVFTNIYLEKPID